MKKYILMLFFNINLYSQPPMFKPYEFKGIQGTFGFKGFSKKEGKGFSKDLYGFGLSYANYSEKTFMKGYAINSLIYTNFKGVTIPELGFFYNFAHFGAGINVSPYYIEPHTGFDFNYVKILMGYAFGKKDYQYVTMTALINLKIYKMD